MKPDFFTYLHNLLASWVGRLNREAVKREGYWCGTCGEDMRFNVPRLGPDGGFVHAKTGSLLCEPDKIPPHENVRR